MDSDGDGEEEELNEWKVREAFEEVDGANESGSFFAHEESRCGIREHVFNEKEDEEKTSDGVKPSKEEG